MIMDIVKFMLVLMSEFFIFNILEYFDGYFLNMIDRSVFSGCLKILIDVIWYFRMFKDYRIFFLDIFKDGFGDRKRISCYFKIF